MSQIMLNEKTIKQCIVEGGFLFELKAMYKSKLVDLLDKFNMFKTYKDLFGTQDGDKELDVDEVAAKLSELPVIGPLMDLKFDEAFEKYFGVSRATIDALNCPGDPERDENEIKWDNQILEILKHLETVDQPKIKLQMRNMHYCFEVDLVSKGIGAFGLILANEYLERKGSLMQF